MIRHALPPLAALLLALLLPVSGRAQAPAYPTAADSVAAHYGAERIELWEGVPMPNSRGMEISDSIANHRVYRVGRPAIYRIAPPEARNRGIAVVICPGGGYQRYAWEVAGFDIARWFAAQGITGFVLTARLPGSPDVIEPARVGIQDVQRALRLIRSRSEAWGIDKGRIGVEGSSAGGHLAAMAAVEREDMSAVGDAVSREAFRPDFLILVSPVITLDAAYTHKGSRLALVGDRPAPEQLTRWSVDQQVDATAPPALLFHADDDRTVPAENAVRLYEALRRNGVSASLHIFPHGGHAISLDKQPAGTELWSQIAARWLDGLYPDTANSSD